MVGNDHKTFNLTRLRLKILLTSNLISNKINSKISMLNISINIIYSQRINSSDSLYNSFAVKRDN